MSAQDVSHYVESAIDYFARAVAGDDVDAARRALDLFAVGALYGDREWAIARFTPVVREHAPLVARAVASLGAESDPDDALPDVLFARSGYALLLDAGVWSEPPLSAFHLGDVDEAIEELVSAHGVGPGAPPPVPPSHRWWAAG